MDDVCACGRVIEQPSTGRRRKWCYVCSPRDRRHQALAEIRQLPVRESDPDELTLTKATRAALAEVGLEDSWMGMAAIRLAEVIDSGKHSASGAAGNVKGLREAMAYAMDHTPEDAKVLDIVDRIFLAED